MKCVYEAANGVEAHMIANLLEQQFISTRIDGEHLTSGIGELPAMGLVRVMADESDFDRAREIIRQWEAKSSTESDERIYSRSHAPMWFMAGVVATIAVMSWVNRPKITQDGIDLNHDGTLDVHYTYSGQNLSKLERDRNLDGKIDLVVDYDAQGLAVSASADDDFDGRFETKIFYEHGIATRTVIDTDGDGTTDIQYDYVNGVPVTTTFYTPNGYSVKKREHYRRGLLVSAEIDTDDDGTLDTLVKYDRYGEVIETVRN